MIHIRSPYEYHDMYRFNLGGDRLTPNVQCNSHPSLISSCGFKVMKFTLKPLSKCIFLINMPL